MAEKPRRLGRGLEALLGAASQPASAPASTIDGAASNQEASSQPHPPDSPYRMVRISDIRPNPFQPRKEFREEDLAQLQGSIAATGLLQPITVRAAGDHYELVAGERRLRAATRLGWTDIPAIQKQYDDRALLTLALVENLQRADLNPVEEADGYSRLIAEFRLTQQEVANVVGKDRSTVANSLRLLNLPLIVRAMLQDGQLTV